MNIDYRQHMYVVPAGTSLGQRLQQQLTPQESQTLLRTSHAPSLRDAAPLSSTRAQLSSTRAPLSSTRAPLSSTRASRRASRSPVRYYSRRREISDYYDEDYDVDMTVQTDSSNMYRGAGRTAGVMIFILVDIVIMAVWLFSLWKTQ